MHTKVFKQFSSVLVMSLIFIAFSSFAPPTKTHSLTINITNLKSGSGNMALALHNTSKGFPEDKKYIYKKRVVPANKNGVKVVFSDLPEGDYAVTVLHDANANGKADRTFIGYPTEGFGFSNNPVVRFSAPDFDDCKIELKSSKSHTIKLQYL